MPVVQALGLWLSLFGFTLISAGLTEYSIHPDLHWLGYVLAILGAALMGGGAK